MSSVTEIQTAILALPEAEQYRLADWLYEQVHARWDAELERDVAAGKLDAVTDVLVFQNPARQGGALAESGR